MRVQESGWRPDAAGLASSYVHAAGWQHMLQGLKMWAMHGLDHRSMAPGLPAMPDAPERPELRVDLPRIQTARLLLRQHEDADVPDLSRVLNDMDVARYTLRMPHPYTEDSARDFLRISRIGRAAGVSRVWAMTLRESGQLVGGIGLRIDASQGIAELGYSLGKAWWGKGFATEAALAVTRHGFEVLKLHKVLACWFVGNEASGRVLEKAGFVREGIRRGQAIRFGKRLDLVDMAAFRDEWLAAHPA